MDNRPKQISVIYRLKFKSEHDFEKAVQTLRFSQNIAKYMESFQRSLGLQQPKMSYPMITTPPEVNLCKEDLVIYLCSYEPKYYTKFSPMLDNRMKEIGEKTPRLPYYYELFLKGSFGQAAELLVAESEDI